MQSSGEMEVFKKIELQYWRCHEHYERFHRYKPTPNVVERSKIAKIKLECAVYSESRKTAAKVVPTAAAVQEDLDEHISTYVSWIQTPSNHRLQLRSLRKLHRLLITNYDHFEYVLRSPNVLPVLLNCLRPSRNSVVQLPATLIVSNIAEIRHNEFTHQLIAGGMVSLLTKLMLFGNPELRENALKALTNLMYSVELRDFMLKSGLIQAIGGLLQHGSEYLLTPSFAKLVCKLCQWPEQPPPPLVMPQLLSHLQLIMRCRKRRHMLLGIEAMHNLAQAPAFRQMIINNQDLMTTLVAILEESSLKLQKNTLRALKTFLLDGCDPQMNRFGHLDFLLACYMPKLLMSSSRAVRCLAIELIVFITHENIPQAHTVVLNPRLLPKLVDQLSRWQCFNELQLAVKALHKLINLSSAELIFPVTNSGIVERFCDLLICQHTDTVLMLLQSLKKLLSLNSHYSQELPFTIKACNGLDKIVSLQDNPNAEIAELAKDIIRCYFPRVVNAETEFHTNALQHLIPMWNELQQLEIDMKASGDPQTLEKFFI